MSENKQIDDYCIAFERALARLSVAGADDIVAEIRVHLVAADAAGELTAALVEIGEPDAYARAFADELRIEAACADPAPHRTLGTLLSLSTRRAAAAIGFLLSGFAYVIAIGFVLTIGLELTIPENNGLWINDENGLVSFGSVSAPGDRAGSTERLGHFYIPVAAAFAACFYLLAGWMGRFTLRVLRGARA